MRRKFCDQMSIYRWFYQNEQVSGYCHSDVILKWDETGLSTNRKVRVVVPDGMSPIVKIRVAFLGLILASIKFYCNDCHRVTLHQYGAFPIRRSLLQFRPGQVRLRPEAIVTATCFVCLPPFCSFVEHFLGGVNPAVFSFAFQVLPK